MLITPWLVCNLIMLESFMRVVNDFLLKGG
jgi:hypothetical protein